MFVDELNEILEEEYADLSAYLDSNGARVDFAPRSNGSSADRLVHRAASVTPSMAMRLVNESDRAGFVVGDIIHSAARETLKARERSYWDRRGSIRIWLPEFGYRLSVDGVRSFVSGASGPDPDNAVTGVGGLSVALAALCSPTGQAPGVRKVARRASVNPSTISRAMGKIQAAGLIDDNGVALDNELFWATSRVWRPQPIATSVDPDPDGPIEWTLSGDAAAARHGASVLGRRRRWYTSDLNAVRKHATKFPGDSGGEVEVCVAPTPVLVKTSDANLVLPVVAALDMSTTGRGREILQSWTGPIIGRPVWL